MGRPFTYIDARGHPRCFLSHLSALSSSFGGASKIPKMKKTNLANDSFMGSTRLPALGEKKGH